MTEIELLSVIVLLLCGVLLTGAIAFACLFWSGVISDYEDKDF